MFFSREKTNVELLEEYLKELKYPYVGTALVTYQMASNRLVGYCFEGNDEVVLNIIKTIVSYGNGKFNEEFDFAVKLFTNMNVCISDDRDFSNYLNNLSVCLRNPEVMDNYDKIEKLYLLFENKCLVQGLVSNVNNLDKIIDYITSARQFYVDEYALCSAALSLDKKLGSPIVNESIATLHELVHSKRTKAIDEQLEQDKENAGVYNLDYGFLMDMKDEVESLQVSLGSQDGKKVVSDCKTFVKSKLKF